MYSLDINFLKDRPEYQDKPVATKAGKKAAIPVGEKLPLLVGVAVGAFLPLAAGGIWVLLQQQSANLQAQEQQLDAQIAQQKTQQAEIEKIRGEITKVKLETQSLANVFNQMKPWSAILQDIRDRTPPNVQIRSIAQSDAPPPAAPAPAASPNPNAPPPAPPIPTTRLSISGSARSYNDINDFLLKLQQSPFFQADKTKLLNATLGANSTPLDVPRPKSSQFPQITAELPQVVTYQIETITSDVPASQLIRELERKGSVGLVNRLKTLKDKGVIQ